MLQPRFMNSTASQSSSSGCVGGSPILPKLSSVPTMPRPKWWCQSAIDDDARGQRVVAASRATRASASRRPDVRPSGRGISVGGFAVGGHLRKPGFICEPRLSGSPRIRKYDGGARTCRALVQVRCLGRRRREPALRTADRLVAVADRREAAVAVGDDLRHRQRRRPLLLERRDLRRRAPSSAPAPRAS